MRRDAVARRPGLCGGDVSHGHRRQAAPTMGLIRTPIPGRVAWCERAERIAPRQPLPAFGDDDKGCK